MRRRFGEHAFDLSPNAARVAKKKRRQGAFSEAAKDACKHVQPPPLRATHAPDRTRREQQAKCQQRGL